MQVPIDSVGGATALSRAALLAMSVAFSGGVAAQGAALTHEPVLGDLTERSVRVWLRLTGPDPVVADLAAVDGDRPPRRVGGGNAPIEDDHCVTLDIGGLSPSTSYRLWLRCRDTELCEPIEFRTTPSSSAPQLVRLAFGAGCGTDPAMGPWRTIGDESPHALVLLGNCPAVGETGIEAQRAAYRTLAAVPEFARLTRSIPLYAIWSDMDFGGEDADGRLSGKSVARGVFVESRPNPSFGRDGRGIYTKFRRGGVEVFLVDTRTFAALEPSPFRNHAASLLGAEQWQWLEDGLAASTAPFKLIACGMPWRADSPRATDHWGSYPHERTALFRMLGERGVSGVVLLSGGTEVDRCAVFRHDEALAASGYAVRELVLGPLHGDVDPLPLPAGKGFEFDFGRGYTFLNVYADTRVRDPVLTATFEDRDGRLSSSFTARASELRAEAGVGGDEKDVSGG